MMRSLREQDLAEKREKRDYSSYKWSRKEMVIEGLKSAVIVLVLSVFFYRSLWAVIPLCGIGVWYWQTVSRRKAQKDRHRLLLQFRDMIRSVAAAMRAGYSVENAFVESYEDMCRMHGKSAIICQELELIQRGLVLNLTVEELLEDLAKRSALEQVQEFAAVFAIAKKNGGSMVEVISSFSDLIHRQVDTREEIMIQTSGRRMEQNIMKGMPFAILTYISISSKGYFDVLYHNLSGTVIMTVCLAVYLAGCYLSDAIITKTARIWE